MLSSMDLHNSMIERPGAAAMWGDGDLDEEADQRTQSVEVVAVHRLLDCGDVVGGDDAGRYPVASHPSQLVGNLLEPLFYCPRPMSCRRASEMRVCRLRTAEGSSPPGCRGQQASRQRRSRWDSPAPPRVVLRNVVGDASGRCLMGNKWGPRLVALGTEWLELKRASLGLAAGARRGQRPHAG